MIFKCGIVAVFAVAIVLITGICPGNAQSGIDRRQQFNENATGNIRMNSSGKLVKLRKDPGKSFSKCVKSGHTALGYSVEAAQRFCRNVPGIDMAR